MNPTTWDTFINPTSDSQPTNPSTFTPTRSKKGQTVEF